MVHHAIYMVEFDFDEIKGISFEYTPEETERDEAEAKADAEELRASAAPVSGRQCARENLKILIEMRNPCKVRKCRNKSVNYVRSPFNMHE